MKQIFIPKNIDDLYMEMQKNSFKGKVSFDGEWITWELDNGIRIGIGFNEPIHEGYIDTRYIRNNKEIELTHWHPEYDEIYKDLSDVNAGQIIWVVKRTLFGNSLPIIMDLCEYEKMKERKREKYQVIKCFKEIKK